MTGWRYWRAVPVGSVRGEPVDTRSQGPTATIWRTAVAAFDAECALVADLARGARPAVELVSPGWAVPLRGASLVALCPLGSGCDMEDCRCGVYFASTRDELRAAYGDEIRVFGRIVADSDVLPDPNPVEAARGSLRCQNARLIELDVSPELAPVADQLRSTLTRRAARLS